jgi:hypothetical protein
MMSASMPELVQDDAEDFSPFEFAGDRATKAKSDEKLTKMGLGLGSGFMDPDEELMDDIEQLLKHAARPAAVASTSIPKQPESSLVRGAVTPVKSSQKEKARPTGFGFGMFSSHTSSAASPNSSPGSSTNHTKKKRKDEVTNFIDLR